MPGLLDYIPSQSDVQRTLADLLSGPRNRLADLMPRGLLGAAQQYISDAAPGGSLNREWTPENVRTAGEVASMMPNPAGDVISGLLAVDDLRKGDYGSAALNSLGLVPFVPAMGGVIKKAGGTAHDLKDGENIYLRFGEPPISGKSKHVQYGYSEDGVSVIAPYSDLGKTTWSPQMIFSVTAGEMGKRPLFLVAGKQRKHNPMIYGQSGFGSDGEPLIDAARILREATPLERFQLINDMHNVATKQFGFEEIPEIFKLLNAEKP